MQYAKNHSKVRARLQKVVDRGEAICAHCHYPVEPGADWDVCHDHLLGGPDDLLGDGIGHRRCNISERNKRVAKEKRVLQAMRQQAYWSRKWLPGSYQFEDL